MRSQYPGFSQPRPRQHEGISDVQVWQQQMMYKQLQEMQRQQQLQQFQQGGKQQNSLNQVSGAARHTTRDQFPALVNGIPVNDASNYTWSNEVMGGDPKLPSSSHMLLSGSMNLAQRSGLSMHGAYNGLIFSHDQGQATRPMGFVPQQSDQTFYGTPVASTVGSLSLHAQFQGTPRDFPSTEEMTNAVGNQAEKASMHPSAFNYFQGNQCAASGQGYLHDGISLAKQALQGKTLSENVPVQDVTSIATLGFQQTNHFSQSVQVQELSRKLHEKAVGLVELSHGVTNLDPSEEKLLFNADDGGNQDTSFGGDSDRSTGGYLHGNPIQNDDCLSAFPSMHGGTWSALMQEAVEASSSDTGLNEEWSGLSFQKMELSPGAHSAVLNDNSGKQQVTWDDCNLQNASSLTSRPLPLFNDADASPNCHTTLQQPIDFSYEQNEGVPTDSFHESFQQSPKEADNRPFHQSHQQKQFIKVGPQMPSQLNNISNGVWAGQVHKQPASSAHSGSMEFNPQNLQHGWAHQQKASLHNVNGHPINKLNDWNIESLAAVGAGSSKVYDNDGIKQHVQRNNVKKTMNMERAHEDSLWMVGGNRIAESFPNSARRLEIVKSDNDSPIMHPQNSYMGNFAAVMTSNNLKLNPETSQQIFNRHQVHYGKRVAAGSLENYGEENVANYQNQPTSSSPAGDSSMTDRRSGETSEYKQENSYPTEVSNEDFISNNSRPGQSYESRGGSGENSLLVQNGPSCLVTNSLKSLGQTSRKTLGPHRFQFHPMGNLEMNMESADPQNHRSYSQGGRQPVLRGMRNQEHGYRGDSQFSSHASNNTVNLGKGNLTDLQKNTKTVEEMQSRGAFSSHSAVPLVDGSTSQFSQTSRTGQASQHMLELLPRVDQSRAGNTVARFGFSEHSAPSDIREEDNSNGPAFHHQQHNQSSALQGFGLKLAPPSQRQCASDHSLPLQTSLQKFNDFDQRNYDVGARERDRTSTLSSTPVNKAQMEQQQQQQQRSSTVPLPNDQSTNASFQNRVRADAKQYSYHGKTNESHGGAPLFPNGGSSILLSRPSTTSDMCSSVASHANSHLRSSGQQIRVAGTGLVAKPSASSAMSQQGGFSTMLHNVWTSVSSQQRLSGIQPQKIISNVLQSMSTSPSSRETNSQTQDKSDDYSKRKGVNASSDFRACTTKPQQFSYGYDQLVQDSTPQEVHCEMVDVASKASSTSEGERSGPKHHSDGNSTVPISSLVCLHQQDLSNGKFVQVSSLDSRKAHDSLPDVASSNCEMGPYGRNLESSDVQKQNYSLLQQMQFRKGADPDPSKRAGKRLKGADFSTDTSQMDRTEGQRYIFGKNAAFPEMDAMPQSISFPSDAKMLRFSSREKEENIANTSLQVMGEDAQFDPQNHTQAYGRNSALSFTGGGERPQISPKMAPSWFEQYGNYKNGQTLTTYGGFSSSQRSTKAAAQHFFSCKVSEHVEQRTVAEQRAEASEMSSLPQSPSASAVAANKPLYSSAGFPSDLTNNHIVLVPKKRKSATLDLLPWHKVVTQGCERLQNISVTEMEWARDANRMTEKVEDEPEMIEGGLSMTRSRRRLILTTQLMQQILCSAPARFLAADATASYDNVIYSVAKVMLGDACNLISYSENDPCVHLDGSNKTYGYATTSEKERDNLFLKVTEAFIGRTRKLEDEFLRLARRMSILDVRLECQDLERCSIINRFAKFHGRAQIEGAESSSTSETARYRTFPQRHVAVVAMPTNLPEGAICLSL